MNKSTVTSLAAFLLCIPLIACDPSPNPAPEPSPQDLFFERLSLLCGKAYAGILVSDQQADAEMVGKPMIMHVASCDQNKIEIPFHIAEDRGQWNRSRTWLISRTDRGLRLKHRHRHEDGSMDAVTNYGGDTENQGTAERQEFPVDAESVASFRANGLDQSVTNRWAVEITPPGQSEARFAYELRRPKSADERHFRVEFDLSKSVALPPPPWGD
ncbi:MAG: hypothetical protein GW808_14370 [Sphingomonadales bacterium]|nr:hypothetical protein [Sphingomonadales bacterium]PIX64175.1 MAG: hypothetical protein COZ43_12540 [Sphingomonadales bacterium CG_4_10_14_3_um_filter_58_15]NCO50387.1 hypothetical protein [Sphingomonadales bacterium]NCO98674.1 hypothetical protein [Sphingomonadales bacterium]NCP26761.1 hypothetical protein [Sphingomonadales bacterium]